MIGSILLERCIGSIWRRKGGREFGVRRIIGGWKKKNWKNPRNSEEVGDNCGRGGVEADANARNNLLKRQSGLAMRSKIHAYAYGNPVRGGQQSLRVA